MLLTTLCKTLAIKKGAEGTSF